MMACLPVTPTDFEMQPSHTLLAAAVLCALPPALHGQSGPASGALPVSAPVSNVAYGLRFTAEHAARGTVDVTMSFDVTSGDPVILALPVWTPGAYEVSNFARNVLDFGAAAETGPVDWDRVGPSGWRVDPEGPGRLTVSFAFRADSLDNAMAWSAADFLLVNGTNVFLHPAGQPLEFAATVTVSTEPGWQVATGMAAGSEPGTYAEDSYHDLVDMPFFIGALDVDSSRVDGRWNRLATYPTGALTGQARRALHEQIGRMTPVQAAVFGETPWESYTTLLLFTDAHPGGSALEHQNSHVGIYDPGFIGSVVLPLITGHEIFHAWNVKRLRPADLWPYRYQDEQPTPWLWVSEGITDYYADLTLVRSGVVPPEVLYAITTGKIQHVRDVAPVALEDASLAIWVHPVDGTDGLYYDKGSLAGLMMDILMRDATDNRVSLDHVLRELYAITYKAGEGFDGDDFWGSVRSLAPGVDWTDFERRYIDGREPYPWAEVLPKAALELVVDSVMEPRIGITTELQSERILVTEVTPGSMAAEAGVRAGDLLLRVGGVEVRDPGFGELYRQRHAGGVVGTPLELVVDRGGETLTLRGGLRLEPTITVRLQPLAGASPKAQRILMGILQGVTDR